MPDTEPSVEALEAAAAVLPITWGKQLVRDVAIALDRFRAAGAREEPSEPRNRRPGFDVGAGSVREGDSAIYEGRECKVLTVYHDGDVQIEIPTYKTVKWRFVTPLPEPPHD